MAVEVDRGEVKVIAPGRENTPDLPRRFLDRRAFWAHRDVVLGVAPRGSDTPTLARYLKPCTTQIYLQF